ncbi:competence protein ComK [Alkalihalophilus sp. As8PL]|uniref:Competence protein ComK n=1 Tax=Alkalihalophilus sp. As8PL TaxID=3237103 RepID=A0AB39BX74_9BACI
MNPTILSHYDINRHTIAIQPALHTDYDTIVLEGDETLFIKESSMSMIKRACIEGGSTYNGRRIAISEITRAQKKVPIPIDPINHIYTFPTHSPERLECSWMFYHHIRSFTPDPNSSTHTLITFRNATQLKISISYPAFERQIQRTSYCILKLTHRSHQPDSLLPQLPH